MKPTHTQLAYLVKAHTNTGKLRSHFLCINGAMREIEREREKQLKVKTRFWLNGVSSERKLSRPFEFKFMLQSSSCNRQKPAFAAALLKTIALNKLQQVALAVVEKIELKSA